MIIRTWRGWTSTLQAEAYAEYLKQTGVTEYRRTPGNQGVLVLRRTYNEKAEFLLLSFWTSTEAIRSFAGPDPGRAVFYLKDDEFLVERDRHVDHFEPVFFDLPKGAENE